MRLSLIAAVAANRVIGANNRIPWHLPEDLSHFRRLTMGKSIIMGRRTFESIGKPLAGRYNIVLTRRHRYPLRGGVMVDSFPAALQAAGEASEAMVIGGEQCYQEALPLAERLYLTLIEKEFPGDAYFPSYTLDDWVETQREPQQGHDLHYTYVTLVRRRKSLSGTLIP